MTKYHLYIPYEGWADKTFRSVNTAFDYVEKNGFGDYMCSLYREAGDGKRWIVCQLRIEDKRRNRA